MSGKRSRDKGARGEREAAEALKAIGIDAHRGRQYHGGEDSPDVRTVLAGVHLEVKRVERLELRKARQQAHDEAGGKIPVVLHRHNRGEWMVIVDLEHLPTLSAIVQAVVGGRGE